MTTPEEQFKILKLKLGLLKIVDPDEAREIFDLITELKRTLDPETYIKVEKLVTMVAGGLTNFFDKKFIEAGQRFKEVVKELKRQNKEGN